jgi:hypothetical protein
VVQVGGRVGQGQVMKEVRQRERALTEQAEVAYRRLVAGWQPKPPARQQPNRGVAAATGARR